MSAVVLVVAVLCALVISGLSFGPGRGWPWLLRQGAVAAVGCGAVIGAACALLGVQAW